jgi:hypothetical protein
MKFDQFSPAQLQALIAANWTVVGFSQGVQPSEHPGEKDATDGYAILLKHGHELAIVKCVFGGWSAWELSIAYPTRPSE